MQINLNNVQYTNLFDGFKNYDNKTGSNSIHQLLGLSAGTSVVVTAGSYIGPVSITIPLNNSNAVSQVLVQYGGLESFYRLLPGIIIVDYPDAGSASYQIQSISYYSGGNLHIDNYVINETGGSVTVPDITFNCTASLFKAPF
jgi:hypothetical protein